MDYYRRRRRRQYESYVQIPGLSELIPESVGGMDVIVGAALGTAAGAVVKPVVSKLSDKIPAALQPYLPALGSALTGLGLYYLQRKSPRAAGHLVGSLAVAASQATFEALKKVAPQYYGDVVTLPMSNYSGLLVDETTPAVGPGAYKGYGGLLVDEPLRAMSDANLAELAAYSMNDNQQADIESLMYG